MVRQNWGIAGLMLSILTLCVMPGCDGGENSPPPNPVPTVQQFAIFAAPFQRPVGIATDAESNVLVFHDNVSDFRITKFTPDGQPQFFIQLSNFIAPGLARTHLALDQNTGKILTLSENGEMREVDPRTGRFVPFLQLKALQRETRAVFDMADGRVKDFSGLLGNSALLQFGDLAILNRGEQLDLFVSGRGAGSTPRFVERVRIVGGQASSKVLVSSSTSGQGSSLNVTSGVAVNFDGAVLTTLVADIAIGQPDLFDFAVTFPADFEPGTGPPPVILFNRADFKAVGMTTDNQGNFYVASGQVGTSLCGFSASGALIIIPRTLNTFQCTNFGPSLFGGPTNSLDVAVDPRGTRAYVTATDFLGSNGAVVRFDLAQ